MARAMSEPRPGGAIVPRKSRQMLYRRLGRLPASRAGIVFGIVALPLPRVYSLGETWALTFPRSRRHRRAVTTGGVAQRRLFAPCACARSV
jgi:hypothetical protein